MTGPFYLLNSQMHPIDGMISVNGQQLYVRCTEYTPGRPTLVFLHDSLGCAAFWRAFPDQLAGLTACNVLVYDRKGYGASEPFDARPRGTDYLEREADVLNALLDACSIRQAILFGHSDGGSIALIAAARYPHRIAGLIAEAAHIFVEEVTLHGIRAAVERYATTDLPQRLERYHGSKAESVFRAWTGTWLREDFRSWSIEHLLPLITCPVLVIQGDADAFGTMAQVDGIVQRVRGKAESFILPGIGHTPHREEEVETMARSAGFVNEILTR